MDNNMLDLYTDYLIYQTKYATATGLSELLGGAVSHDKVTRFLRGEALGSQELWLYIKTLVRKIEHDNGVLILDDTVEEKPYTDENEIVAWHHDHSKNCHIKGINLLTCMVKYNDIVLPIAYEIVHKDVSFSDVATHKEKRKASISKNEHFRNIIGQSVKNNVKFQYVLADSWFGSADNFSYIHGLKKDFIIGVKSNRTVALSAEDKANSRFLSVSNLDIEDGKALKVWLKDTKFPVAFIKKTFINEDDSVGILYLISSDLDADGEALYETYKKRWNIEVFHKSIKQNASLAKSPTKRVKTQANHVFASMIAFCKLEMLKLKTATNHFAIKFKLTLAANLAAMNELKKLYKTELAA